MKGQKRNKFQISNFKFQIVIGLFAYLFICLFSPSARADTMSNEHWIIELGNLNSGAGVATGGNSKLTSTIGQTAPGLYIGKNFVVRAGFYSMPSSPFSFSLDQSAIDFGILAATNPVTRTSTLTISNKKSPGYQVIAYANRPLKNETNVAIPDTTCDNGSCTESTSAPWISTLTYGFGYRCDSISNISCSSAFAQPDYYRQFADISKKESAQTIVLGKGGATGRKAKITYKVNISGTQMAGNYSNTITYIAAPTY